MADILGEGADLERLSSSASRGFSQHRQKLSRSVFSGPTAALLRERIISGALPAGTKMVESRLADELAVSRGPIRNALQALESEGLVRTMPNGRVEVVGFSEADVEDLLHTRFILESAAAELAIAQEADLAPLVEALEAMESEEASTPQLVDLDIAFHIALLAVSGSRFLSHSWKASASVIHAGMTITNRRLNEDDTATAFAQIIAMHRKILDGMLAHDVDQAIAALHEHFGISESVFRRLPR